MSTVPLCHCLLFQRDWIYLWFHHTYIEMLQKKQQRTTGTSLIKICDKNFTLNHNKHKKNFIKYSINDQQLKKYSPYIAWIIGQLKIPLKYTKTKKNLYLQKENYQKCLQNCKTNENLFQTTRKDKFKTNISSPQERK